MKPVAGNALTRPLNLLPTVAGRSQARAVYGGVSGGANRNALGEEDWAADSLWEHRITLRKNHET